MNIKLKTFIQQNRKSIIAISLVLFLGGIALAYFTGNAEPWGTIGGIFSAIGFLFILMALSQNKD